MARRHPVKRVDDIMKKKTAVNKPVELDETLEISDVAGLLVKLKSVAETGGDILLDGSQIKVIDTANLQLLVSLFREMKQHGTRIDWQQPSDTLCKTAVLLGLEQHICLSPA